MTALPGRAQDARYFSADTEIILSLDFRRLLDAELVKQYDAAGEGEINRFFQRDRDPATSAEARAFIAALGIDPLQGLDSVTIAAPASLEALVILHKKIDARKLRAAARNAAQQAGDAIEISKVGEHEVYEISRALLVFLSLPAKDTILASVKKSCLDSALKRRTQDMALLNKKVADLYRQRDPRSVATIVVTRDLLFKLAGDWRIGQEMRSFGLLQDVVALGGSVTVTKGIEFRIDLAANSPQEAEELHAKAKALLFIAKLALPHLKESAAPEINAVAPLIPTLSLSRHGAVVSVRGRIPLDAIVAFWKPGRG
jgi:hypothetical protein